jgi:hypothetical protein
VVAAEYPPAEWYTDVVTVNVGNDDLEKANNRAKEAVMAGVSSKIRSDVESSKTSINSSEKTVTASSEDERVKSLLVSSSKIVSNTRIFSIEVAPTYYDKAEGMVYAFAAVRRADLAAFYKKLIDVDLNKVETAVSVSEQLVSAGKKMSAFRKCEEVKTLFKDIELYQDLLVAVNSQAGDESLQATRSKELIQTIEQRLIDLEQSTFVYVDCQYEFKGDKNDAFSSDPGIICDIVKQALSENDCSVVDADAEADYTLTLTASTTQRSDGSGQYSIISYYANVKGTLYNRMTKKKTVDFSILNAPDAYSAGKSPEDAATKAFKLPALKNRILEKILNKIKN